MDVFEVLSTVAEAAGTVSVEGASEAAKEAVVEAAKEVTQEIAKDTLQGILDEATKDTGIRINARAISEFPNFFKDIPSSGENSDANSDAQSTEQNTDEGRNTEQTGTELKTNGRTSDFPDFFKDMPLNTSDDRINNETHFAENDYKHCPVENGEWSGERGNSEWHPDKEYIPGKSNPDGKSMGEILNNHGIDKIVFKSGEPDFSEICKGNVEIEHFTENRTDNFDLADIKMAEQKGCLPEEIRDWRKSNGYTWHECKDMKTMQLVPSEIHNNIPHSGGISEIKRGA